jgi:hypothetical protein
MNNDICKLIRKRAKLHKKAKQNNTDFHWSKFNKNRNDVTTLIRKSKLMYQNKLIEKKTPKEWYKSSKKINKEAILKFKTFTKLQQYHCIIRS